jgi:pantoate--beta-alanine ligase
MIDAGERRTKIITEAMASLIREKRSAHIDYISIVDAETLHDVDVLQGRLLITLAVQIGKARLIDNIIVTSS